MIPDDPARLKSRLINGLFGGALGDVRRLLHEIGATGALAEPIAIVLERLSPDEARELREFQPGPTVNHLIDGFAHYSGKSILQRRTNRQLRLRVGEVLASLLVARRGAPRPPPSPPRTIGPLFPDGAALDRWAAERGLQGELGHAVASKFMRSLDRLSDAILLRQRPTPSLRDLLLDDGERGRLSRVLSENGFQAARTLAEGWIAQRTEETDRVLLEERKRLAALPAVGFDPDYQRLAETIRKLHGEARAHTLPPSSLATHDRMLFWNAQPETVVVKIADGRDERVGIDVSRFPDVVPRVECTCHAPACSHRVGALQVALEVLLGARKTEGSPLKVFLSTPRWRKHLAGLDAALVAPEDEPPQRVTFRVQPWPGDARLHVYVHKPLKSGAWSAGSRMSDSARLPDDERRMAKRVGALIDADDAWSAIELLIGTDRLFLDGTPDRPLTVRRGRLTVTVEHDGDLLRLAPTVDGDPQSAEAFSGRRGRRLVHVDGRAHACVLVELTEVQERLLAWLGREQPAFPAAAVAELAPRFQMLERAAPLSLPPDLEGDAVEPEPRPVLRLQPLPSGIAGAIVARPLPGVELPPGEGPARVSAFVDGRRVHAARDLDAERTRAEAVESSLPLDAALRPERFRFELAGDDEALDLLAATHGRDDFVVEWPAGAMPKKVVATAGVASLRVQIQDRRDWFGVTGAVDVGEGEIELAALIEAVRAGRRYVALEGGRFAAIERALRDRLAAVADLLFAGRGGLEAGLGAAPALSDLADAAAEAERSESFRARVEKLRTAAALDPPLPDGLRATLRPYQIEGYRWLMRLAAWDMGGVLADDMGLGKTVQALAAALARAHLGPALVVAPTSVCGNWLDEAARFAPSLRPILYRETDRAEVLLRLGQDDLLVASYGLVVRHAEELSRTRFSTLIIDEAQAVKNPATRRARAVRDLDAGWRIALSGTPVENHLGELWSLMRVVTPGLLGSWEQFRDRFAAPIERDRDPRRRLALARAVRPFILRRSKAEVAPELPPRTEIRHAVALSVEERRLYDAVRLAALSQLTAPDDGPKDRRFQVLAALTRLRQLACHPRLFDEKSTVPSSKLAALLDLVDELREGGHRALVFSQFTSHLALVRQSLDEKNVTYLYLDGQTPEGERRRRVDAFQKGEGELFLISLKAGGTGLNLTAADYVIHLDPWWNPAVEDQASDRAHRIGQTRPVTVYRLVAQGTIEEAILALHDDKRDLVAGVLDGSDAAARLSTAELVDLMRLGAAAEAEPDEGDASDPAAVEAPAPTEKPRPRTATPATHAMLSGQTAAASAQPAGGVKAALRLDALIERCKAGLRDEFGPKRARTVATYCHAIDKFATSLAGAAISDGAALEAAVDAYWRTLPGSTGGIARAALGRLTRLAPATMPPGD